MRPEKVGVCAYRVPVSYRPGMRVPGIIFADEELLKKAIDDKALDQVANVACLPGIVKASLAMPDIHWGYGFPIGGVAALRPADGVVSPGGVGYDISCGVRLLRTNLKASDLKPRLAALMHELSRTIPKGLGRGGKINLSGGAMDEVLLEGARWAVAHGYGRQEDLDFIEQGGAYDNADPDLVSQHAKERGRRQLGTVGSGNHFIEVQEVIDIYDERAAAVFGLTPGRAAVMIHSGSRGLGHQVCGDYLKEMDEVSRRLNIDLPDRQLAYAPLESPAGRRYLKAMAAAANFALANRQCLAHWVRKTFERALAAPAAELGMDLVYDVSHNIAQMEEHEVDGKMTELCVHRKGATRAFGPGRPEICEKYRALGQPVIIPGDMGRASFVLLGTKTSMHISFGSTCHGAGRLMSRKKAKKQMGGAALKQELAADGIIVEAGNLSGLAEEAPYAYKNVADVVEVCRQAGLSKKVARLRPLGVLKG